METASHIHPTGLYRLKSIVRTKGGGTHLFDIAASTWWQGVKTGRFPKPVRMGTRMTLWVGADLIKLVEELTSEVAE